MASIKPRKVDLRKSESESPAAETSYDDEMAAQAAEVAADVRDRRAKGATPDEISPRGGSIYRSGTPACAMKEPKAWLLQMLSARMLSVCERFYSAASDGDLDKRRWLNVWRALKATFEAFLTDDDEALEHLGSEGSKVLRHVVARGADDSGWPSTINLERIGLHLSHQLGDVPFVVNFGRDAARVLVNTLRLHILKMDPRSGKPVEPREWEPSMTAEMFANMAPGWAAIVHEPRQAAPRAPLVTLVPDDMARFFSPRPVDEDVHRDLMRRFDRWKLDYSPEHVTDEALAELARSMLLGLGAPNGAVQRLFRDPDEHAKDMQAKRKAMSAP